MAEEFHSHTADEIIEDIKVFLPKLVQACDSVAKLLYEPMDEAAWQQFGDVVEGIDDLYKALISIDEEMGKENRINALQPCIEHAISGLQDKFQAMNLCIDEDDFIGASDYLRYELSPLFEQISIELGENNDVLEQRFKANMLFLQKKYPEVYGKLHSLSREENRYQAVNARNALPNLCMITIENKPLYLYSKFNPAHETHRWTRSVAAKVESKSNIIMYGFGFGYHATSYAEAYPGHSLSIYEPNEQVLLAAMRVIYLQDLFSHLNISDFVVGSDKAERYELFYNFIKYMKGEPEIIALPVYDKMMGVEKERFLQDAQMAIMNYANSISNHEKFGLEWATNSMYNLGKTLTTPSILGLKDKLSGMTAVVVGAGPSLEADIEVLRKLKKYAFIIAAGSTIQSLMHYGIKPHLIVSMDGTEANYAAFKDIHTEDIPFLYSPTIKYRILEDNGVNLFHVHLASDWTSQHFMKLTEADPIFRSNHSVTGTAIQAAIYMGCQEIVFTGQDLSYPSEQVYSPGAKHATKGGNDWVIRNANMTVRNVHGTLNRTNNSMKVTLRDIEDLLGEYPEVHFINASRLGAVIKHTEFQPLNGVLARLQHKCIKDDFFIIEMINLQKYDKQRVNKISTHIANLPKEMSLFLERLKRIDRDIGKLSELSRINQAKCLRMMRAIDDEWELIVNSSPFMGLYLKVCKNEINLFERDLPEFTKENNTNKQAEFYRTSMRTLIHKMIERFPELTLIVNETKRRMEECIK